MSDNKRGFYFAEVAAVEQLTKHMVRVTFGGGDDDVAHYQPLGAPDECITIFFPRDGENRPPAMTEVDGVWWYHGVDNVPEGRNYTVRRHDGGQLVVDFVAHEGGVAASWALRATVGQVVGFTRPRSWYAVPSTADWQLLVADMTGLPALGRIVEQLPAGAKAHVIGEVLERSDIQQFETAGDVTYDWRIGSGNGDCASVLDDAVKNFPIPDGEGYVWFAGEASCSRSVRKFVRKTLGFPTRQFEIIGYWRANSEQWLKKYEKFQEEALAVYNGALEAGRSQAEASEEFDAMLERVGL